MTEKEIISEIIRYLSDTSYNYAVMIDGNWGCGKTYFVNHGLTDAIKEKEKDSRQPRKPLYISLYGCRSILDIQDSIAVKLPFVKNTLGRKVLKRIQQSRVVENSMQSAVVLAKAARDIYAPNISAFDIAVIWKDLKSYIFIFDDIERCSCPLNEVFGFINGLVEHDAVKAILVANEREIKLKEYVDKKELQYLIALDDKVQYPTARDLWGEENKTRPLSVAELERRRRILFPTDLIDEEFKKIREKLIGVILHFQPDVKAICVEMVKKSCLSESVKQEVCQIFDSLYAIMQSTHHLNLRTFEFYLSKLKNVFDLLSELDIPPESAKMVNKKVILDCFSSAVDFKANILPPEDETARINYEMDRENRLISLKQYIETGELQKDLLQDEISDFINEELLDFVPAEDPYKLLKTGYYLYPQSWCEERISEILNKIENNEYPLSVYIEIIQVLLLMESIGFDTKYLDKAVKQMLANIASTNNPKSLNRRFVFYEGTPAIACRAKQIISEIEEAIAQRNNTTRALSIEEALQQPDWAAKLLSLTGEKNRLSTGALISNTDSEVWIALLKTASPETINKFREWLSFVYSDDDISFEKKADIVILQKVSDGLNTNEFSDLIVKKSLQWLKGDIEKICAYYQ